MIDKNSLEQLKYLLSKSEEDYNAGRVFSHAEVKEMAEHYEYGNK